MLTVDQDASVALKCRDMSMLLIIILNGGNELLHYKYLTNMEEEFAVFKPANFKRYIRLFIPPLRKCASLVKCLHCVKKRAWTNFEKAKCHLNYTDNIS